MLVDTKKDVIRRRRYVDAILRRALKNAAGKLSIWLMD